MSFIVEMYFVLFYIISSLINGVDVSIILIFHSRPTSHTHTLDSVSDRYCDMGFSNISNTLCRSQNYILDATFYSWIKKKETKIDHLFFKTSVPIQFFLEINRIVSIWTCSQWQPITRLSHKITNHSANCSWHILYRWITFITYPPISLGVTWRTLLISAKSIT